MDILETDAYDRRQRRNTVLPYTPTLSLTLTCSLKLFWAQRSTIHLLHINLWSPVQIFSILWSCFVFFYIYIALQCFITSMFNISPPLCSSAPSLSLHYLSPAFCLSLSFLSSWLLLATSTCGFLTPPPPCWPQVWRQLPSSCWHCWWWATQGVRVSWGWLGAWCSLPLGTAVSSGLRCSYLVIEETRTFLRVFRLVFVEDRTKQQDFVSLDSVFS